MYDTRTVKNVGFEAGSSPHIDESLMTVLPYMGGERRSSMKAETRFIRLLLLGAATGVATPNLGAQTLLIPAGSNGVQVTAAAEREGATYRRAAGPSDAAPRTCALPWFNAPVKSGEFTIGGDVSPVLPLTAGRRGKIWWSPIHHSKDMPPLVLRARNLTTMKDTARITLPGVAYAGTPGSRRPESERTYFFPSGTTLPTAGRWLVIATSGSNWGCFILTVVAPGTAARFGM